MDDFIAQNWILGDSLVLCEIFFLYKNAKKARISGFGRYFFLSVCSKVRFGAILDFKWAIFRLVDLATLPAVLSLSLENSPPKKFPDLVPFFRRKSGELGRLKGGGGFRWSVEEEEEEVTGAEAHRKQFYGMEEEEEEEEEEGLQRVTASPPLFHPRAFAATAAPNILQSDPHTHRK